MHVRYGQLSVPGSARKHGVLALGVGVNRLVCAFVSREIYWTNTAAVHIMPAPLNWRRDGAAAKMKPCDTLSVYACASWMSVIARD